MSRPRDAESSRRTGLRRYVLLLAATALSFAIQGIAAPGPAQQVVVTALAGATLLLAFRVAALAPRPMALAATFTLAALALSIVRAADGEVGEASVRATNAALVALGPPAVAVGIVRDLRSSGRVQLEAVLGVLALYMLLGMAFGFVYGVIDRLGDGPFFADGDAATVSRCLYFSFATLATIGYGDLVASSDLGRTVAVSEGLIGQIYLVTVVSLIVSNLGRPAGRRR
ncbi:MAG: potassium channel family protein [Thermoleophilaceae bacterium]